MPQLLKHRYRILRMLSEAGGFAYTFLGEVTDTPARRRCVIKKLRPFADPEEFKDARERFEREAAVLERLGDASDQIPKLYAYFVEDQEFYLVQEFVEGLTLRQIVRRGGPLDEKAVGELLIALLGVLAYVHEQNVIHRDIKPDNVILRVRDNKPVLIDFGVVKEVMRASRDGSPTCTMVAGTPGYIPPEQAAGHPVFASDLYGLGVTAMFLLTGKSPRLMTDRATAKTNWRQHAPRVSPAFAAVLDKSTETYVHNRYQTTTQMRDDLREALRVNERAPTPQPPTAGEAETIVKPATPRTLPPDQRRQRYALYLGIAAVVLGLLVVIGSAASLEGFDMQQPAENTETKREPSSRERGPSSSKPRQTSVGKAAPSGATQARTPAPTESPLEPLETADVPGRFPEASTRLLTANDLVNKSQWELRIIRNEIFARHGYVFNTPEMRGYFAAQRWYSPRYNDVSSLLSDIEIRNLKIINTFE